MMNHLQVFKKEIEKELFSILDYWQQHTIDNINGGFYGRINNDNKVDIAAPKGCVLNARILWAFSAAFNQYKNHDYLNIATRAFEYVSNYFIDQKYTGVFWSVDSKANMLDGKKQVYALAFCIYGFSEYYAATKNENALQLALQLYNAIEQYSYDVANHGYIEAFKRDWFAAEDVRLSEKDVNVKKTMNTHLHIIEAYANLYKVSKNEILRSKIIQLLELFDKYFINKKTFQSRLFFDDCWNEKINVISYGHDVEAAWLLLQCAEIINHKKWIDVYKQNAVTIAGAAFKGVDRDGGMWYEYDSVQQKLIKEKHWWVQAEAMIGFYNAWQISGEEKYLEYSINNWQFIKQHIIDNEKGEWFWGVKEDYSIMKDEDKVGIWKCPYHNSRACIEIIKRVS